MITKRTVKASKLTIAEGDANLDWTSKGGEDAALTVLLNRTTGVNHGDDDGSGNLTEPFASGTINVDLKNLADPDTDGEAPVVNGFATVYMNLSSNPTINLLNAGTATVEYPNGDTISTTNNYYVTIAYRFGKVQVFIPGASSSGDTTAPTLVSATIEDAAPTNVVMVFSEVVTGTNLGFTIAGTTSTTFSSISGSGTNTITGVLGTAAANGESPTVAYDATTGDIADSASNVLQTFAATAITNNIAASYVIDMDFSTESVGAYTKTTIVSGSPTIVDDSGSKLRLASGGTAQAVTADLPSVAWDTLTSFEVRLEDVSFPVLAAGVNYLFGALEGAGLTEGIIAQLDNTGNINFNFKIDGTDNQFSSGASAVAAATTYSSVSFRAVDNGSNLDCDILVNDSSVASSTISGKNISDCSLVQPLYIGGRNLNGAFDGNDIDMTLGKFRTI